MTRHVVIAGGGIAGLATALCFDRIGWRVTVLEQADAIGEVGAGLQLSPNGMKVLGALGLTDSILGHAVEPEAIEMRIGRSGRRVFRIPLKTHAQQRWGARYVHVHRADLIETLAAALAARQPAAIRTGQKVAGYGADHVRLNDGSMVHGDLVVGADGIHSVLRTQMLGVEAPEFTGNLAWRMTVPAERLADFDIPATACIWAGAGRHAVTYRIRRGTLVNFVGIVERSDWRSESWAEEGTQSDVLADFNGWHPALVALISQADRYHRWALHGRQPLSQWSDGPAVLVGDAAHPMLPTLAQGAVMGIEDAWVLARLAASGLSVNAVGSELYRQRIERVSKVQATARRNMRNFHHSGSLAQFAHYAPMWVAGHLAPALVNRRLDWLYGMDVTG